MQIKPLMSQEEVRAIALDNIQVKIIADSISAEGARITTFQLRYPRFVHAEVMTHRVFSRNASSSRAIPVAKVIEQVRDNPAMPIHWGKNQSGMQANEELTGSEFDEAFSLWLKAAYRAASIAQEMTDIGLHKQVANRILEPFQYIEVVLTATDFSNFFGLRVHKDAQPEIYRLAAMMEQQLLMSQPNKLEEGEWHLPYITQEERNLYNIDALLKISAARCCRVSYLRHDGLAPDVAKDMELCERLVGSEPLHASPFEHQAKPDKHGMYGPWLNKHLHGNFTGWIQHRKIIESKFKTQGK